MFLFLYLADLKALLSPIYSSGLRIDGVGFSCSCQSNLKFYNNTIGILLYPIMMIILYISQKTEVFLAGISGCNINIASFFEDHSNCLLPSE